MTKNHRPLAGLLLCTTALLAPGLVHAQAANPTAAQGQEVEEVVVRGKYIPEVMRETSEVAAILTTEDLARTGDDTAAEALTRVTGLSLVQGRFVYVRGLGERYSSALLNGSPLPSPEPLQRVIPLDLFPSSVLAGVQVQKTYSANYPGEFGGGVIDLTTVSVPATPFFSMSLSGSYNDETSGKSGLVYYGSDTDDFGFDDGTRKLPGLVRMAIATGKRVDQASFSAAEIETIGQSFVNAPLNLIQRNEDLPLNGKLVLSGGRSFDVGFASVGFVAVLGYENAWQNRRGKQQESLQPDQLQADTDFDFFSTQNDIGWDGFLGLGLEADGHELRWTNLWVRRTTKEARQREGEDFLAGRRVQDSFTEWFERELLDTQLSGRHTFGDLELNWRGSYAETRRDAPYEKQVRYRITDGRYFHDASNDINSTKFSYLDDKVVSGGFDLVYRVPDAPLVEDLTVSGGYAYLDNDRQSTSREFRFAALNNALPLEVQAARPDFLFSDVNIWSGGLVLRETTGANGAAAYDAALRVHAAYAQAEAEVLPLVRASVGLRFEDAEQRVTPIDVFATTAPTAPAPLANDYLLPAATVTWNFAEDRQLRLGVSRTIARPQFRELAPQQYQDPESDRLFVGNPYLEDTKLLNFDARFEWYFERGQYLTLGAFYKDIDKPVESTVTEQSATLFQTYLNAPKATLYGLEAEVKRYFDASFGVPFFDNKRWLLQANYTYSKSEVHAGAGDTVRPFEAAGQTRPATDYITDGSRLQGQSEHLANLQLGWEDDAAGSQLTLLATYASDRIVARERAGKPDRINEPGLFLDLTYRKEIDVWDRALTFSVELRNLLDENFEEFQEAGGERVDIYTYDLGRTVSLGVSAKF